MDFSDAKNAFLNLVNSVDEDERPKFFAWIQHQSGSDPGDWYSCSNLRNLRVIAEEIKTMISPNGVFPSERIIEPIHHNSDADHQPTVHVDSFLFDEVDLDSLIEEGKLSRNYCKNCQSQNVAPINFISHSASIERIEYIFKYMLPNMDNKILLDIGSRLGAILYGAYLFSSVPKIIGVEMNEDMCKLQNYIVQKYNMQDRIQVICSDICKLPEVIRAANVIVLNNVFEFFMSKPMQSKIWMFLRSYITQPGTILITVPSMEETLSKLETGIDISKWLHKVPVTNPVALLKLEEQDLLLEVCSYVVL